MVNCWARGVPGLATEWIARQAQRRVGLRDGALPLPSISAKCHVSPRGRPRSVINSAVLISATIPFDERTNAIRGAAQRTVAMAARTSGRRWLEMTFFGTIVLTMPLAEAGQCRATDRGNEASRRPKEPPGHHAAPCAQNMNHPIKNQLLLSAALRPNPS